MRVEPAAGKPATETKIVTLFLLGKKKGHPGNIFTKLKLLNVDDFLYMKMIFIRRSCPSYRKKIIFVPVGHIIKVNCEITVLWQYLIIQCI